MGGGQHCRYERNPGRKRNPFILSLSKDERVSLCRGFYYAVGFAMLRVSVCRGNYGWRMRRFPVVVLELGKLALVAGYEFQDCGVAGGGGGLGALDGGDDFVGFGDFFGVGAHGGGYFGELPA